LRSTMAEIKIELELPRIASARNRQLLGGKLAW
jgi:hypothetical protein